MVIIVLHKLYYWQYVNVNPYQGLKLNVNKKKFSVLARYKLYKPLLGIETPSKHFFFFID